MNYRQDEYETDYPAQRRRRMGGPLAIFGRGRMLSFVMMGVVTIFSYLSNNNRTRQAVDHTSSTGLTVEQIQQQMNASRTQLAQRSQVLQSNPLQLHGGIVEDARATQVRSVGARLAQHVPNLPANALRFFVLQDTTRAGSYALQDGSILITAGMLNQMKTEDQLANVLSQRMTEVLYNGVDRIQNPQIDQFPSQLVTQAGYSSTATNSYVTPATGPTQPAYMVTPATHHWNR